MLVVRLSKEGVGPAESLSLCKREFGGQVNTENWEDILTLMTMVVLADKKVYKEEVDMFVQAIYDLNNAISPDIFFTESMAFEWFKSNRDRVRNQLIGRNADRNLKEVIIRMKGLAYQEQILISMARIAHADSEYHNKEHKVIQQAAYSWRLPYPASP